jgi:hypothetical protein
MKTLLTLAALAVLGMAVTGCSDNTASPAPDFGPPTSVLAQSLNTGSVGLSWSAPQGLADTALAGYIITYGDIRDSIAASPRLFAAVNLLPGVVSFTMQSVSMEGEYSSTVSKSWAPATRYDSVFVLYEYDVSQLLERNSALSIGSRTSEPSAVPVGFAVQLPFDAYVVGQGSQPLALRGGQLFNATYPPFVIADRADAAPSLDYYIDQFPSTFPRSEVVIRDNTIYYGRGYGDGSEVHYVRIHVRFGSGTYPNRTVIISLSVQKVVGLQFALAAPGGRPTSVVSPPLLTHS